MKKLKIQKEGKVIATTTTTKTTKWKWVFNRTDLKRRQEWWSQKSKNNIQGKL